MAWVRPRRLRHGQGGGDGNNSAGSGGSVLPDPGMGGGGLDGGIRRSARLIHQCHLCDELSHVSVSLERAILRPSSPSTENPAIREGRDKPVKCVYPLTTLDWTSKNVLSNGQVYLADLDVSEGCQKKSYFPGDLVSGFDIMNFGCLDF